MNTVENLERRQEIINKGLKFTSANPSKLQDASNIRRSNAIVTLRHTYMCNVYVLGGQLRATDVSVNPLMSTR